MADVGIQSEWMLRLSTEEFRLVLRSLGGRLSSDDERQEAEALGDRLTFLRGTATQHLMKQADQALSAVAEKLRKE